MAAAARESAFISIVSGVLVVRRCTSICLCRFLIVYEFSIPLPRLSERVIPSSLVKGSI